MSEDQYSPDKPIQSSTEDVFNRGPFAKNLAKTISENTLEDGYVIGLYSEWGYGKTSTLNLIKEELETNDNVEVIEFNPWLYVDIQAMILGLFDTLAKGLDAKLNNKKEEVGKFLKKVGGLVSTVGLSSDIVSGAPGAVASATGNILDNATLDELRERINGFIKESNKRLVVIIDDVDRLDKDEVFQLFKLIKIAVDFQGIAYLISFDDVMVSKVLGERFGENEETGQSFIEKIIQVPIHLPLIDPQTLNRYVLTGLDKLLDKFNVEISQEEIERFRESFDEVISINIRSPRMANRYLNALRFILPLVGKEINYTDILIIEAIRLLFPKEYNLLRRARNEMTGLQEDYFVDNEDKKKKIKHYIETSFPKRLDLVRLLVNLFPAVDNAMKTYGNSHINELELKKMKRASSLDYFDRYFTYGIAPDDVSDQKILDALKNKDIKKAGASISSLVTKYNGDTIVDKLITYAQKQTDGKLTALTLISIIDVFSDKESSKFMRSQVHRISDLIFELVKNYKGNKTNLILDLMSQIKDLDLFTYYFRDIRLAQIEESTFLSANDYKKVQKSFITKLNELSNNGTRVLHKSGSSVTVHLYSFWKEIVGEEEFNNYLNPHIKSSKDALELVTKFLSTWHGSGAPKRGDLDRAAFEFLKKTIDIEALYPLINKYNRSQAVATYPEFKDAVNVVGNENSTEFKKILARQFLYLYARQHKEDDVESSEDQA
ncbi:MAG: hypothetical protein JWO54_293 [Candidatus Saccharibacteria bacterium]|nr:hypothetical protein [Candidatus Saccharibacteria bacterium]